MTVVTPDVIIPLPAHWTREDVLHFQASFDAAMAPRDYGPSPLETVILHRA